MVRAGLTHPRCQADDQETTMVDMSKVSVGDDIKSDGSDGRRYTANLSELCHVCR